VDGIEGYLKKGADNPDLRLQGSDQGAGWLSGVDVRVGSSILITGICELF